MIALFERFKLAIKYRAVGCPSPWRWAGRALQREKLPGFYNRSAVNHGNAGIRVTSGWEYTTARSYGCGDCHGTGWVAVTMRQIEKCRCVPPGRNPDPHPSIIRPNPPPAPPPRTP